MEQINAAGGSGSFAITDMTRLRRFLILGAEGGTLYASERKLTLENAAAIARLLEAGEGTKVVDEILAISLAGRAPKQPPTLFALAMVCRLGDLSSRQAAYAAVPKVCRTPTMLFMFISFVKTMMPHSKGWGRGLRRAVSQFYCGRPAMDTAFAVTKYRQREGWTHKDVLRLAHVKPTSRTHDLVIHYAVTGEVMPTDDKVDDIQVYNFLHAVEDARKCEDESELVTLIKNHGLVREHLPTTMLNSVPVWVALLHKMPLTALTRNLGKMTSIGLLAPLSEATRMVYSMLTDPEALQRARVHPITLLVALMTYRQGHGQQGRLTWEPNAAVVSALEGAFYQSFKTVTPTGKRYVLGLDVSGSMSSGGVAGSCVTPREASAALAMVTLRTEKQCHPMGFSDKLVPVPITASDSLDVVMQKMSNIPMGSTDCALPMLWAAKNKVEADVFIVYTDSETWYGDFKPAEALRLYRVMMKIDAKLIVVGMTSGGFSIADPEDAGMLDVVGFDTSTPQVMQEFVMGNL